MNSYAIIRSGGKQYKIAEGDTIAVEKLNMENGAMVSLDEVLLVSTEGKVTLGRPLIDKAKVKAKVIQNFRDSKVKVVKFKSKSNYLRSQGHRQSKTKILIEKITS
jgi:large subunit ribosomal protein L21